MLRYSELIEVWHCQRWRSASCAKAYSKSKKMVCTQARRSLTTMWLVFAALLPQVVAQTYFSRTPSIASSCARSNLGPLSARNFSSCLVRCFRSFWAWLQDRGDQHKLTQRWRRLEKVRTKSRPTARHQGERTLTAMIGPPVRLATSRSPSESEGIVCENRVHQHNTRVGGATTEYKESFSYTVDSCSRITKSPTSRPSITRGARRIDASGIGGAGTGRGLSGQKRRPGRNTLAEK